MKKFILITPILLASCATMFNSEPRMVFASGTSEDTFTLTRNGTPMQKNITLPMTIAVPNGWDSYALQNTQGEMCPIGHTVNGATFLNLLLGGIIGLGIDAATGDMVRAKSEVYCSL